MISQLLVLVFATSFVSAVEFTDCGGFSGRLLNLKVSCNETDDFCEVNQTGALTISATFLTNNGSKAAAIQMQQEKSGSMVNVALSSGDACKDFGLDCPLRPHQVYTMSISSVTLDTTQNETTVRVKLLDDNNGSIFCRQFPVSVAKK